MKRNLLVSFLFLGVMLWVMQWQGHSLITPTSPHGILDVEFARTPARFHQLQLFLNPADLTQNIYLDFLFIVSYVWFFYTACTFVTYRTGKQKWPDRFAALAITAGLFDVLENLLILFVLMGRFDPKILQLVFYVALIKFFLVAAIIVFLLVSLPSLFRRRNLS